MTAFKPAVGPEPSESPLQLIVSLQKIRQSLVFLFWQMLDISVVQVDSDPGNLFLIQTDSDRLQIIDGSRDGHFEFPLVRVNDSTPGVIFRPSLRLLPSLCLRFGVHQIFAFALKNETKLNGLEQDPLPVTSGLTKNETDQVTNAI